MVLSNIEGGGKNAANAFLTGFGGAAGRAIIGGVGYGATCWW